jgi:hypothetical protein
MEELLKKGRYFNCYPLVGKTHFSGECTIKSKYWVEFKIKYS